MVTRLAVTGVSHWHALHDAAYPTHVSALPGVALVALHDPAPGRAETVAAALGLTGEPPACHTDLDRLISDARPDFVLALGRPDSMAATAHRLLDAGLPFLMEKPMGLSAAEVAGIADRAAAIGGFAAAPLFQRYLPFVATARAMIAEGRFGPLSHLHLRNMRPTSQRYVDWGAEWMLDPKIAGGGCLRNIGLHGLDLFCHILGEDAEVTACQLSRSALGQPVEDYALVLLRSASGVLGTVEVGNTFPFEGAPTGTAPPAGGWQRGDSAMRLAGRDALLTATDGVLRTITSRTQETAPIAIAEPPARTILRDTIAAWRTGKPPVTSAHDCARAMALADRAYALAATAMA